MPQLHIGQPLACNSLTVFPLYAETEGQADAKVVVKWAKNSSPRFGQKFLIPRRWPQLQFCESTSPSFSPGAWTSCPSADRQGCHLKSAPICVIIL